MKLLALCDNRTFQFYSEIKTTSVGEEANKCNYEYDTPRIAKGEVQRGCPVLLEQPETDLLVDARVEWRSASHKIVRAGFE